MRDSARVLDFAALSLYRDVELGRGRGRVAFEQAGQLWLQAAELYARTGDSTTRIDRMLRAVRSFAHRSWTDSVLVYAPVVLAAARTRREAALEYEAMFELASALHGLVHDGPPDSAMALYRRLIELQRRRGDAWSELRALYGLAVVHRELDRADSVKHYVGIIDARLAAVAATRRQIATAAATSVSVNGARAALDSALRAARGTGDRLGEEQALALRGSIHYGLGQLDSATFYFEHALALARELGDRAGQRFTSGGSLGQLGGGIEPNEERYPWDATGEAGILAGLGKVQRSRGDLVAASRNLRRALELSGQTLDPQLELAVSQELARVHEDLAAPDSALAYIRNTLWIAARISGKYAGDWEGYRTSALSRAALIHLSRGFRDSASAAAQGAKESLAKMGRSLRLPVYRDIALYHRRLGTAADIAIAVTYLDSAAALVAQSVAFESNSDIDRISLIEQSAALQSDRLLTWLARTEDVTAADLNLAALAVHEGGLGGALRNLMQQVERWTGLPDHLRTVVQAASAGKALVEMLKQSDLAAIEYAVTSDTLVTWLVRPTGEVDVFRRPVPRDSLTRLVAAFRRSLGVDTARTDTSRRLPALERMDSLRGFGIKSGGDTLWEMQARTLADILLPAALVERIPPGAELVIVPQGILALVPFAALPLSDSTLMGARHAVGYSPSLAILGAADDVYGERWHPPQDRWTQSKAENDEWLAKRRRSAALKSPLVLANPVMPAVRGPDGRAIVMPPLLAAESEGRRVAAQLGTEARIGAQASEAEFRLRAARATVVHLATHGYAYSSEERSGDSFIALAPGAGRDGLLSVSEVIAELPALVADLVVLSACQTGLGNLKQSEGTLGLQRAFLSRGARSVLVSLWNVSDESTARLMTAFYSHWLGDADHPHKAVALYRAQNEVRSQPEFAHPRYWAAFQLVGAR